MKTDREVISEIIEVARRLERTQIAKDDLENRTWDGSEETRKKREERLLDYDFDICTLGERLNTLAWIYEE